MIVVVGSVNRDLVVRVDRHPDPGETVLGLGHETHPGGKGANQAVAASRLGSDVVFVGRVGEDPPGASLLDGFERDAVDAGHVVVDPQAQTGLAVITVDRAGENAIVVSPGANVDVGVRDIAAATGVLAAATVTLLQLEIPVEAVAAASDAASGIVIVNAAPAVPIPSSLLRSIDVLVVNRGELAALTGSEDPLSARSIPVPVTVVTVGADGAYVVRDASADALAAPIVPVVDTTGAGDTFCGALAAGLDAGLSLDASAERAVVAGSLAVGRIGARSAMPTSAELSAAMRAHTPQAER